MTDNRAPIEPTESLYLVALLPPSNVARVVSDLQAELFRRHRLVSALGLGVLLPLAFSQSPPSQPRREPAESALRLTQAGSLKTGELVAVPSLDRDSAAATGGALYLEVGAGESAEGEAGAESGTLWLDELAASFRAERGLFPLHLGLFLADLAELAVRAREAPKPKEGVGETEGPAAPGLPARRAADAERLLSAGLLADLPALSPDPPLSWATSELVCLALRVGRASSWWSFVEYETIWSVRLRRARPGYRSG